MRPARLPRRRCPARTPCSTRSAPPLPRTSSPRAQLSIKNSDIAKHLSLPPVKLHCSMLAEDAIKAAVKDIKEKRAKQQQQQATAATA